MNVKVYIDECGNTDWKSWEKGQSGFFIVTAIIIDSSIDYSLIENCVKKIQDKYYSSSEIKSSGGGSDKVERRIEILDKLNELPIQHYSVCIEKEKIIEASGLIYKKSFFKYCNSLLYDRLLRTYENISVEADKHGRQEFMNEFTTYIEKRKSNSLFSGFEFKFTDSKDSAGVQIADYYAGSIRKFIETKRDDLGIKLKRNSLGVHFWPPNSKNTIIDELDQVEIDDVVQQYSIRQAEIFVEKYSSSDNDEELARAIVVEYMLGELLANHEHGYIYSSELLEVAKKVIPDLKEQSFRQNIIAKIRDEGVIIASSQKGLKIPISESEMLNYYKENQKKVLPMIKRVILADEALRLASSGKKDLLNDNELKELKILIDAMKNENLCSL